MNDNKQLQIFIDPKIKKWVVFIEGRPVLTLTFSAVRPIRSELKVCKNFEQLEKLIEKAALHSAMEMLSKRDYLRPEIKKKLEEKGFWKGQIASVLERLEDEGILDDRRFISAYIESKRLRYGPRALRIKLVVKGAEKSLVDEILNEISTKSEVALIEKAFKEADRKSEDLSDFKTRQKWMQRLVRRGCSVEQVRSFLDGIRVSYRDS